MNDIQRNIQTLSEFLQSSDASFRIFDMGRRISKLSRDTFLKFEQTQIPYPTPYLQHAWLGLLLWNPKASQEHVIWFLKLPLDEQGLLVQTARDDFLYRLLRQVNIKLFDNGDKQEDPLKDNPFTFTPDQEKMAAFHARASLALKHPASPFYEPAHQYLSGVQGYDRWEDIGLQGLADICARLDKPGTESMIETAIAELPPTPLSILSPLLENESIGPDLSNVLAQRLTRALANDEANPGLICALLRGLSQGRPDSLRISVLQAVLESRFGADVEVLVTIAVRCWNDLKEGALLKYYLEKLALSPAGQDGFNRVVADLIFIPGMRIHLMACFRDPDRTPELSQAIGGLLGGGSRH
jgi:hypothetical protein